MRERKEARGLSHAAVIQKIYVARVRERKESVKTLKFIRFQDDIEESFDLKLTNY